MRFKSHSVVFLLSPGLIFDQYLSRLMTKPTKWMCAQRRLRSAWASGPVWSESAMSAWRKLGSLATHWAHSEDWSDWADAQADLSLRWAHMPFCWFCHDAAHLSNICSYHALLSHSLILQYFLIDLLGSDLEIGVRVDVQGLENTHLRHLKVLLLTIVPTKKILNG